MRTFLSTWKRPGEVAIRAALEKSGQGGSMIESIEQGLSVAEADPHLVAIGLGSVPNLDGEIELDAAIMDGSDLSAGAVCSVRGIIPVIKLARLVKDETPHVMLSGDQARRFAIEKGFVPTNLMTAESCRRYQLFLDGKDKNKEYVHTADDEPAHDTITMLAREDGHFVAASSTSGLPFKLPGRVGDSPIVGAGVYADNEAGCAGATGSGEELWKAVASFRAVEHMRQGHTAQEACDAVIDQMVRRQPGSHKLPCVVLALDRQGGFGAATTKGVFDLWVANDGKVESHRYTGRV